MRRYKNRLAGESFAPRRSKAILSQQQATKIKQIYTQLKVQLKPLSTLDGNDLLPGNFRIRKGKIYFVDVEAIKPQVKGFGIAKHFFKWAKITNQQKAFLQGYSSISSLRFFTTSYKDFCDLLFLIQALNYKAQVGRDYTSDLERLNKLLLKYESYKYPLQ